MKLYINIIQFLKHQIGCNRVYSDKKTLLSTKNRE